MFGLLLLSGVSCSSDSISLPLIRPDGGGDEAEVNTEIVVGEAIPAWQEGMMDIHFINTTTGESAFIIMPDGTQLLIDAAGSTVATNSSSNTTNTGIRSRWDPTTSSTRGGQIVADYVKKCMQWTRNNKIDYVVATHMHNDHIGGYSASQPKSANSDTYTLTGLTEIFDNFTVGKVIDRGYPDYNYPFDMATLADNASSCKNYIAAVKWGVSNKKFTAEIFKSGVSTQIVPLYNASKYSNVKIQNIAVNGEIWTGSGSATTKTFPELAKISYADSKNIASSDNCPPENINSCVMKISYGDFDYFAGADLQYNGRSTYAWKDAELPCAKVCGQVEVMKADHHGTANTNQDDAIKVLNPQAIVVNSWVDCHPRSSVLNSMETILPNCDFYITNFWLGERPSGVDDQVTSAEAARVKGYDGHIIVRVTDSGKKYKIVTVTDKESYPNGDLIVKSIGGSYTSR